MPEQPKTINVQVIYKVSVDVDVPLDQLDSESFDLDDEYEYADALADWLYTNVSAQTMHLDYSGKNTAVFVEVAGERLEPEVLIEPAYLVNGMPL